MEKKFEGESIKQGPMGSLFKEQHLEPTQRETPLDQASTTAIRERSEPALSGTTTASSEQRSQTAPAAQTPSTSSPRVIDVIEDRLNVWLKLVKELVADFEAKAVSQHRHAQVVSKCAKISNDQRIVSQSFSPDSDINKLLIAMHDYNVAYFTESTNNAKTNEVYVISGLEHMIVEIKRELKEVGRDQMPLDREIGRDAAQIETLRENFSKALTANKTRNELTNVPNEGTSPKVDPWLIKNEIDFRQSFHDRNIAAHKSTGRRRQDSYAAFESNLVLDLKKLLTQRFDAEMKFENAMQPLKDEIKARMDTLEPTREFGIFVADNQDRMIYEEQSSEAMVGEESVRGGAIGGVASRQQTGDSIDPSVDVVYEGELMLKKGMMLSKSWKVQKAVITGTGYLHAFATDMVIRRLKDDLDETIPKMMIKYEPEYSLCLHDCEMQPHPISGRDDCEIELHEIGRGGLFTKGVTIHVFKAMTREGAEEWWRELSKWARTGYAQRGEEFKSKEGVRETTSGQKSGLVKEQ